MNGLHKILLVLALLLTSMSLKAINMPLPTVQIAGKQFNYYQIGKNESIQGISQKLGVPVEDILKYNSWAKNGLEKQALLFLPAATAIDDLSLHAMAQQGSAVQVYELQDHDNIFIVMKKFNASIESIFSSNPGLTPAQYISGTTISVQPNTATPLKYNANNITFAKHKVQGGETLASIAAKYGVTSNELKSANPGLDKPKKGKSIVVPVITSAQTTSTLQQLTVNELQNHYSPILDQIYNDIVAQQNASLNIGIILPFQLQKSDAPKQAYLYTDFYKGFMIALDSIQKTSDKKVNLSVYDTQHNLNITDSLLALPEMKSLDVIIAPTEPKQLARIEKFGNENNIMVLNSFSTKDEEYLTNPNVMQVNSPTSTMIRNVTKWFTSRFADYTFLIIEDESSSTDRNMINLFVEEFAKQNIKSETIRISNDLTFDDLSKIMNPGTKYVLLPANSSKSLLKKVISATKEAKANRFDCELNMVGYPEYVLYLKDYQSDLMAIDTYVFSRFFNTKGFRSRDIDTKYEKMFGGKSIESYPNMAIYGFDTANYIYNVFGNNLNLDSEKSLYKGIQTGFRFTREHSAGFVNQAIEIAHFSINNTLETFVVIE